MGAAKHGRASRSDGTIRLLQSRLDGIVAARETAPPPPLAFDLPAAVDDTPEPLLQASELTLGGRVTLPAGADLELSAGDRLLVRGRNGAGKSSLLAMLAGDLRPDAGGLVVAPGARIGLLGQEDDLDPHEKPLEVLAPATPQDILATGPLGDTDLHRALGRLSVGAPGAGRFGTRAPLTPACAAARRAHQPPLRPVGRGGRPGDLDDARGRGPRHP